jgi:ubiquinone/menaquinone biosynthesis C-methylase UbiE
MSEELTPKPHRSRGEIAESSRLEYGDVSGGYGTSLPAILRLLIYRNAVSHNPDFDDPKWNNLHVSDIHHIQNYYLYNVLGISKSASVLDIGCGDGSGMLNLAMNYEHTGDLFGVNISPASYYYGEQRATEWEQARKSKAAQEKRDIKTPNIKFFQGDAMDLPEFLKQRKFNVVKLDFILYHLPNPQEAIDEALEVMDDDGFLVVSTRGEENMSVMWEENFPRIGKHIGATPPATFYADYPISQLEQDMAERGLVSVERYPQREPLNITPATLNDYALAHAIMYNHFTLHEPIDLGNGQLRTTPTFETVQKAVNEVVVEPAMLKMAQDPNFTLQDRVHQLFIIYQKSKKTKAAT